MVAVASVRKQRPEVECKRGTCRRCLKEKRAAYFMEKRKEISEVDICDNAILERVRVDYF